MIDSINWEIILKKHLPLIFIFALIFGISIIIAKKFKLFKKDPEDLVNVTFINVFIVFILFFSSQFFFTSIFYSFFGKFTNINKQAIVTISYFLSTIAFLCLLFVYLKYLGNDFFQKIFKRSNSSIFSDIKFGFFIWPLAYFGTLFISQLIETIILLFLKVEKIPNQSVSNLLQNLSTSPTLLIILSIFIVIVAPTIEELLFRGFLQNYLKKITTQKTSIIITSIIFSLVHFSASQGIANIVILISLVYLSLILGWVYEKRKSLISCISLHAVFNLLSIIGLFLQKE